MTHVSSRGVLLCQASARSVAGIPDTNTVYMPGITIIRLLVAGGVGALSLSDYVPQLLNEFHPQVSHDSCIG